jgi:hypothetical protein
MNDDIINKIKIELDNYINNHINYINKTIDFHNGLQKHIASMGKVFGFKSVMEYKICNRNKYYEYIDVVWMDKKKNIVYAIEIDSSLRTKSIKKLNYINAENKIWILYCNDIYNYNFKNLMNKYNINKEISIIYLGAIRQFLYKKFKKIIAEQKHIQIVSKMSIVCVFGLYSNKKL